MGELERGPAEMGKTTFVKVPNAARRDNRLTLTDHRVLQSLLARSDWSTGHITTAKAAGSSICEDLGWGRRRINNVLKSRRHLIKLGYLEECAGGYLLIMAPQAAKIVDQPHSVINEIDQPHSAIGSTSQYDRINLTVRSDQPHSMIGSTSQCDPTHHKASNVVDFPGPQISYRSFQISTDQIREGGGDPGLTSDDRTGPPDPPSFLPLIYEDSGTDGEWDSLTEIVDLGTYGALKLQHKDRAIWYGRDVADCRATLIGLDWETVKMACTLAKAEEGWRATAKSHLIALKRVLVAASKKRGVRGEVYGPPVTDESWAVPEKPEEISELEHYMAGWGPEQRALYVELRREGRWDRTPFDEWLDGLDWQSRIYWDSLNEKGS